MNKIIRLINISCVVIATVILASCSTSRSNVKLPEVGGLTGQAYMEKVIELAPQWKSLSGKVALTLNLGSQGNTKMNATMRLMRDQSIRFTVAPLLGIEMARLEISPDGVLLLDRLHKRYCQIPFSELSEKTGISVDFNAFQSLFLNEMFLPGKERLTTADAGDFTLSLNDKKGVDITPRKKAKLTFQFLASATDGLLWQTLIQMSGTPYALRWKYDTFEDVEGRSFPKHMNASAEGLSKNTGMDMKFSKLTVGGDWDARTTIPDSYSRIELKQVIDMLKNFK